MSCRQPGAVSRVWRRYDTAAHARAGPTAAAAESSACGRRNTVGLTSILHRRHFPIFYIVTGWLSSRVVSMLDSGAVRPGFKSQSRRCRVTVLGKLFTPIVPLFTKQQNWQQPS